jgi:hypothetical protein
MEINRTNSPNSDKLTANSLALGGTLTVTNLSSINRLKTGDTFTLFSSPSAFTGSITVGTLPALWPGLSWSTGSLNSLGTIAVTGAEIPPVISSAANVGGNLTLSGTGGLAGATYYVVSTNNLTIPLASWPRIATNTFAAGGTFTNTFAISSAAAQNFFTILAP